MDKLEGGSEDQIEAFGGLLKRSEGLLEESEGQLEGEGEGKRDSFCSLAFKPLWLALRLLQLALRLNQPEGPAGGFLGLPERSEGEP